MIKINLLREGRGPTRAAAPTPGGGGVSAGPANFNMIILLALVALLGLIGAGWTFFAWRSIENKRAEVARQEDEAAKLRKIIEEVEQFERRRDSLEKRIALINQLKQNQKGPVRLLDHISRDLPDLVWLDEMKLSGKEITITGRTLNPNAAATFVENIKGDPMFDEPEFNVLSAQGTAAQGAVEVYTFDMKFNVRYLEDPASSNPEQAPAQGAAASPTANTR